MQIRPKLPIDRVLFLISYALDPAAWMSAGFDFAEDASLVEAIMPGFVRQVRHAFARGLLQGYRTEEEALTTVRGRIRINDQIRCRYGIAPPVEVTYDDFTEDIDANRLIKAAVRQLAGVHLRTASSRADLRVLDDALAAVSAVEYDPRHLPTLAWSRLNEHYRPAVNLATLILRSSSFDLHAGSVRSNSFLVDMNDVFEDFVVVALREALGVSQKSFVQGGAGRGLWLDHAGRVALKPDISWWEAGGCRFVGDVKYKRLESIGGTNPDLYQSLSYVVAADLPRGLLIYAGSGREAAHDVVHVGRRLEVIPLDVSSSPDEVLASVHTVAERRIRTMRSASPAG